MLKLEQSNHMPVFHIAHNLNRIGVHNEVYNLTSFLHIHSVYITVASIFPTDHLFKLRMEDCLGE